MKATKAVLKARATKLRLALEKSAAQAAATAAEHERAAQEAEDLEDALESASIQHEEADIAAEHARQEEELVRLYQSKPESRYRWPFS
jgi:hypothetical protein